MQFTTEEPIFIAPGIIHEGITKSSLSLHQRNVVRGPSLYHKLPEDIVDPGKARRKANLARDDINVPDSLQSLAAASGAHVEAPVIGSKKPHVAGARRLRRRSNP